MSPQPAGPRRRALPALHEVVISRLVGGAAVVAVQLAAAAPRRGYRCTAWVPGAGPAATAFEEVGVPWRAYDFDALGAHAVQRLAACARMAPFLAGIRPSIVHVHNPVVFGWLAPALRAVRARSVVHFHIAPDDEEIRWVLAAKPTHIVTCARYISAAIERMIGSIGGRHRVPVTSVPNAVNLDKFVPGDANDARARLGGLGAGRFVVLVLANLAPHKGQETALRAVGELVRRGVPIECWFVGEDRTPGQEFERALRVMSTELGVDDYVRFLGFRQDAELLMRAADVFMLASTHEGLPLSVLEAQASGVPVLGSDIPGVTELVEDGVTGLIVPAHDHVGYAERLATLYGNPALGRRLAETARAQVMRDHAWGICEARVFDIYEALAV